MSLRDELGYLNPIKNLAEETLLNVILTGTFLVKEGHRVLKPFKITVAQFHILMLLNYQTDDGGINQTKLGKMLLVNRANITGLIDRMEKAGLVRRLADPEDRRVNYVKMTDTGKEFLERAHDRYFSRIEEIMAPLGEEECRLLNKLLEMMRYQVRTRKRK
jgi:DNA-binding MarR family transcriptional regulator